ncbi:alpha/beta hydrolase [Cellulosimicrobium sp. XJ-DQ-B-000]|uniref:alpha/beta fold hydrolase n=1 Tax=Cellulosimicrobium sp. XJ-DQ-B-000 TaxID=3072182 RepID=UPI00280809DB|nr:alpha/beta hydrolase [Cellulosimicrobium sp. XJ-DQ-B-000]MDQ8041048.1 alpha/beta hydrolase [Cellulosimicrobium sp. XJ-DQ-B-000]
MRRIPQAKFKSTRRFNSSRTNLHTREDASPQTAFVLVHGLNSAGYRAWGSLPEQLFDRPPAECADIAVYDYANGLRALGRRSDGLDQWAAMLDQTLESLAANYESIYIIAHSMGGLVAQQAARTFLERNSEEVRRRLAAICYIATPFGGSALSVLLKLAFEKEEAVLRRNSRRIAENGDFFRDLVEVRNLPETSRKYLLPTYAVVGNRDRIVSTVSASFGAPSGQRHYLDFGHVAAPKANEPDSEVVQYIERIIRDREEARLTERRTKLAQRPSRVRSFRENIYITDFETNLPDAYDWHEAYLEAISSAAATGNVDVRDRIHVAADASVDLAVIATRVDANEPLLLETVTKSIVSGVRDRSILEAVVYVL